MSNATDASLGLLAALTELPTYPLNFVRALMQIGHEPLAPFNSKDILGRDRVFYPNTFKYLSHIRTNDGFSGLYRGLGMKMISTTLGTLVYHSVVRERDLEDQLDLEMKQNHTETTLEFFRKKTGKEINSRCWAIIISHPFHVMAMRCMAQHVGGETIYSSWNVFQNAAVIYRGEGAAGFFSGLIPRLIFEATTIAVINGLAYSLRTFLLDEEEFEKYIDTFATFMAHAVTYPLSVVTTVSCISGSGLKAALPPNMPNYSSWLNVFQHLYETNGFRRGSSNFFRICIKPVEYSVNTV